MTATIARISVNIAKVAYNTEGRRLPSGPLNDDGSSSMLADRSSTGSRRVPAVGEVTVAARLVGLRPAAPGFAALAIAAAQ
jgi:hypothetical protein